jgi:ribosomal protein S18 acetylase RimI-like enzyme
MENIMTTNTTQQPKTITPKLEETLGLKWRGFRGDVDFPGMLKVIHQCAEADGLERAEQLEDMINNYTHLHHSDPYKDMLFAEVEGEVVGYTRCWWEVEGSGRWIGFEFGGVRPQWRHKGIGSEFLRFTEQRLEQIARELKAHGEFHQDAECLLDMEVQSTEADRIHLLERKGYAPVRYAFSMVRPDLLDIPDLSLPEGLEVRPVNPEHYRLIWEASNVAFRDHWGYIPDPWESFEQMVNNPDHDPSLWRVAWHVDEVVGMVLSFIDKDENEKFGRKRGYTENICVKRAWRKKGVASALIAMGLKAIKARGMTEAALGVDAENISGALHLYEHMGYKMIKRMTIYRKKLNVTL